MNFTVNSQAFAAELRLVNQVVPTKATLPALLHVKLEANADGLYLYGTDLEVGLSTSCAAVVSEPGAATLAAKHLLSLMEQLPDGDVQLTLRGSHVGLVQGDFRTRLQAMPADEFPRLPVAGKDVITLPTAQFQEMIRRVRYAISDKKYVVDGALLSLNEGVAALVATDGRRLALTTMPVKMDTPQALIIPTKTLDVLTSMFADQQVAVALGENHLFFQSGARQLISRMLDSKFPQYERVIPRQNNKTVSIDGTVLAAALRRVGLTANKDFAMYLDFTTDAVELSTSNSDLGDATERISCRLDGEPVKICLNWKFALEFLDVARERVVHISLKTASSPILLTDGENHLSVITLMR